MPGIIFEKQKVFTIKASLFWGFGMFSFPSYYGGPFFIEMRPKYVVSEKIVVGANFTFPIRQPQDSLYFTFMWDAHWKLNVSFDTTFSWNVCYKA